MLPIPEYISVQFNNVLRQRAIPASFHVHYRKWLRYFLDFCEKYAPPEGKSERIRLFIEKLKPKKQTQMEVLRELHDKDLAAGYAGVFLPDSLEKKYPAAAKDFLWQWFFPQKGLTLIPGTKEYRRYHLHESKVQAALKKAVRCAKLTKRVRSHTFRHPSFAGRLRYSDDPDNAGSCGCENNDDLYSLCTRQNRQRRDEKPYGFLTFWHNYCCYITSQLAVLTGRFRPANTLVKYSVNDPYAQ
ncbi:conserved hypothetical protein [delta proteobacterium NaphS2]|nr:conserved hypothetical protein [delta proteobacterium NaphS2]